MAEKDVAEKLKKYNPAILWKPVSDKFGVGTPDRACKFKSEDIMFWAELKEIKHLPKKSCKIGLKSKQAAFLAEWSDFGGNSCVIVGVRSLKKVSVLFGDFMRVYEHGMNIEDFNLIDYSKLTSLLRGVYGLQKKTTRF